jgi:hypothetical protein
MYRVSGVLSIENSFSNSDNSLILALKGTLKVDFSLSDSIEFTYPKLIIDGTYKNRRTIKWDGSLTFIDGQNNL